MGKNLRPRIPRTIAQRASREALREALLARRGAMAPEARRRADEAIVARLDEVLAALPCAGGDVLGVYWPVRGEPDLRAAMARWHRAGRIITLPRVVAAGRALAFGRWEPDATMRAARFGIPVPEPFVALAPALLVVPCVGFDARGYRLGYGGGYYDRTLAGGAITAIGVAYDACEIEDFEPGAHDRRLAMVVTQTRRVPPG